MSSEKPETLQTIDLVEDTPVLSSQNAVETASSEPAPPGFLFSGNPVPNANTSVATTSTETPPQKPPRPLSPQQQAQATLREAFPSIDAAVIRAILVASGGQIEPAFTALLSMSDPSFAEEVPPPQPPRPEKRPQFQQVHSERPERRQGPGGSIPFATSTPQTQLEADELYARQLADDFGGAPRDRTRSSGWDEGDIDEKRRRSDEDWDDDSDKGHSFLDDDLPVIKENLRKGFLETQNKVNSWISDFKKRLDGDSPESSPPRSLRSGGGGYARSGGGGYARSGSRPTNSSENSGRKSRDGGYDADPRVLSDDFTHLELRDNTASVQAPQPRRPKANPGLFHPTSTKPAGRKVSFDERPTTISDDDLYRPPPRSTSASGPARQPSPATSKWEPLKSVEPTPMDRDPFSLGDSDDERESLVKEGEPIKSVSTSSAQETGVIAPKETK